jgi:hypothetical protein
MAESDLFSHHKVDQFAEILFLFIAETPLVIETVVRVIPGGVPDYDFLVAVQQRLEIVIAQDGESRDIFFTNGTEGLQAGHVLLRVAGEAAI